jgi:hypothetical protein
MEEPMERGRDLQSDGEVGVVVKRRDSQMI